MRSLASLLIIISVSIFAACTKNVSQNPATSGSLRANSAEPTTKLFERRGLDVAGFRHLNEFIRPEVRERLDTEPTGDSDVYVPPVAGESGPSGDAESQEPYNEDNPAKELEINKAKFQWAKKKFGDALAADPTATGVIILYADENYYDIGRLNNFVEEGRGRIASESGIYTARIQLMYGGYRGVAQVEMWIVPSGEIFPDLKPENLNAVHEKEL